MRVYAIYTTSELGRFVLAAEDEKLVGAWFEDQKYFGLPYRDEPDLAKLPEAKTSKAAVLQQTSEWLDAYFAGKKPNPEKLPLDPEGTIFQKRVWRELLEIHYGETSTYGLIAFKLAQEAEKPRMSAQAVGGAVGHNPISIIIPCHRVIAADGSLTGYAGGIERKQWLLSHEEASLIK